MIAPPPAPSCPRCHQAQQDARHQHPHDFSGTLADMEAGRPCLACNRPHTSRWLRAARIALAEMGCRHPEPEPGMCCALCSDERDSAFQRKEIEAAKADSWRQAAQSYERERNGLRALNAGSLEALRELVRAWDATHFPVPDRMEAALRAAEVIIRKAEGKL